MHNFYWKKTVDFVIKYKYSILRTIDWVSSLHYIYASIMSNKDIWSLNVKPYDVLGNTSIYHFFSISINIYKIGICGFA